MKKLVVLFATIVLAFSLSFAQTGGDKKTTTTEKTTTKTTEKTKKTSTKAGANTITGCLAKGDTGYTIANGNYKNGLPVQTDQDFTAHVGHKVQLTGTLNKEGGKATSFTATSVKHISPTCTVAGGKGGKGSSKTTKSTTKSTTTTTATPK
jgi:hypothetical protein